MKKLKSYLITDPKYYTSDPDDFSKILTNTLSNNKIDIACFRDKTSSNTTQLIKIFIKICKQHGINQILVNSDIDLAIKLGATGIHLNSKQFDKIIYAKKNNLYTIISCHTQNDIKLAITNGADAITYSPIFTTPNKGEPKGINTLIEVLDKFNIPIIALGGIVTSKQINQIKKTKSYGFASIRYFVSNNLV